MTHMPDLKLPPDLSSHILFAAKGIPHYCSTTLITASYFQFTKLGDSEVLAIISNFNHIPTYAMIFSSSLPLINHTIPIEPPVSPRFSPIQL